MQTRNILFAAILAASPMTAAMAQGTAPDIRADATHEATEFKDGATVKPTHPGAVRTKKVVGNHSTVSSDKAGTDRSKSGGGGGGGK